MSSVLITGITGNAGWGCLQKALADPAIHRVTALTRRPVEINHPKLEVVIHQDFADYTPIREKLRGHDACLWCLGTSTLHVRDEEEYFRITHTYAIEACKAMNEANPSKFTFCFLSGRRADLTGQSRIMFARVKGKTENDLQKLGLGRVVSFRPGYIDGRNAPNARPALERAFGFLSPLLYKCFPDVIIDPLDLAKAMIKVARFGSDLDALEHRDIREVASTIDI